MINKQKGPNYEKFVQGLYQTDGGTNLTPNSDATAR